MKRVRLISVICFFLLLTFALSASNVNELFPNAVNGFGLRLMKYLSEDSPDENVVISPVSISLALTMAMNGAEGETLQEMKEVLGYERNEFTSIYKSIDRQMRYYKSIKDSGQINIDNLVIYDLQCGIRDSAKQIFKEYFAVEFRSGNFFHFDSLMQDVNNIRNGKSRSGIYGYLDSIHGRVTLFLYSLINMKCNWENRFEPGHTIIKPFYSTHGRITKSRLMQQCSRNLYNENEIYQTIRLPLDGNFYLDIYLPYEDVSMNEAIDYIYINDDYGLKRKFENEHISLSLPKFNIQSTGRVKQYLISHNFSAHDNFYLNLNGIVKRCDTFAIGVSSNTYLTINENGIETADSLMHFDTGKIPPEMTNESGIEMKANRPFLFIISDTHTNAMLFLGKVMKPEWND